MLVTYRKPLRSFSSISLLENLKLSPQADPLHNPFVSKPRELVYHSHTYDGNLVKKIIKARVPNYVTYMPVLNLLGCVMSIQCRSTGKRNIGNTKNRSSINKFSPRAWRVHSIQPTVALPLPAKGRGLLLPPLKE